MKKLFTVSMLILSLCLAFQSNEKLFIVNGLGAIGFLCLCIVTGNQMQKGA